MARFLRDSYALGQGRPLGRELLADLAVFNAGPQVVDRRLDLRPEPRVVGHRLVLVACGTSTALGLFILSVGRASLWLLCFVADHPVRRVNWALDSRRLKSASKLTRCSL